MLGSRLGGLLLLLGITLTTGASCTSGFSNGKESGAAGDFSGSGGPPGLGGGRGGTPGSGGAAALGGTAGRGGSAGAAPGGRGGRGGRGGTAGSGGDVTSSTGGMAASSGTTDRGGTGGDGPVGNAGTQGEAGDTSMAGMTGTAGAPSEEPLSHDALVYWFSADFGVIETSGAVSKWLDRSGNGADAAQISADSRPKLGHLNDGDLPAIAFDGENDYLGMPPLTTSFENGLTFFAVARATAGSYCQAMLELSNAEEVDDVSFGWVNDSLQYEVFTGVATGQDGAFTIGETRLLEVTHATNYDAALWMNGLANGVGDLALPAVITRGQNFIGRSLYQSCSTWPGEISEIILYSRVLELDERQSVEAYLQDKWSCCTN